jgi:hypothetical protein
MGGVAVRAKPIRKRPIVRSGRPRRELAGEVDERILAKRVRGCQQVRRSRSDRKDDRGASHALRRYSAWLGFGWRHGRSDACRDFRSASLSGSGEWRPRNGAPVRRRGCRPALERDRTIRRARHVAGLRAGIPPDDGAILHGFDLQADDHAGAVRREAGNAACSNRGACGEPRHFLSCRLSPRRRHLKPCIGRRKLQCVADSNSRAGLALAVNRLSALHCYTSRLRYRAGFQIDPHNGLRLRGGRNLAAKLVGN